MAGGKLSNRQKMINLMYLVFLAMIALNMGKQVLDAFGLVNQKFEVSNRRDTQGISSAMEQLALKASESPFKGLIVARKRGWKLFLRSAPSHLNARINGLLFALCAASSSLFIAPNLPSGARKTMPGVVAEV